MENSYKSPKKANRKPLYILIVFFVIFTLFIYGLTKPSLQSTAISEVRSSFGKEAVKANWEKYKSELSSDEDFILEVRNKLSSFGMTESEIAECKKWLPAPPESINLIIVPDLSGRITDTINNPSQINSDTILLNHIYKTFENIVRLKTNSKDRLMVDVTGADQVQGQFRILANNLVFDLSSHKNKSNILYFDQIQNQFNENVSQMYSLAKVQPQGADYWYYLNRNFQGNIKKSTLYDNYRNLLIIITDGYLEAQDNSKTGVAFYTGGYNQRLQVSNKLKQGIPVNEAITSVVSSIMDCSQHYPNVEALVLEVNTRKAFSPQEPNDPGTPRDYDILKKLWVDWFNTLEIKNAESDFFNERLDATDLTKKKIEKFISKAE
jgi:hypothetical protein